MKVQSSQTMFFGRFQSYKAVGSQNLTRQLWSARHWLAHPSIAERHPLVLPLPLPEREVRSPNNAKRPAPLSPVLFPLFAAKTQLRASSREQASSLRGRSRSFEGKFSGRLRANPKARQ